MILTFVSPDGTSTVFSQTSTSYRLLKNFTGFGDVEPEHQSTRGNWQNGSTLLDTHLNEKEMNFDIHILGTSQSDIDTKRAALITALSPLNGAGTLYYTYENGTQYYRTCINNGGPVFNFAVGSPTHLPTTVKLIAHDPIWKGTTVITPLTPTATSWIPWFAGAWVISGTADSSAIVNGSDHSIPVKITIYGGTGSITDCRIINDETGEYLEVSGIIAAGDSFEIDTGTNEVNSVDYTGAKTNGYYRLNILSTFWKLLAGSNTITVTASASTLGSYVTIEKTEGYVGR
jgi:hypothetical protein